MKPIQNAHTSAIAQGGHRVEGEAAEETGTRLTRTLNVDVRSPASHAEAARPARFLESPAGR